MSETEQLKEQIAELEKRLNQLQIKYDGLLALSKLTTTKLMDLTTAILKGEIK